MKKLFLTLTLLVFFALGKLTAQTVYITDSGKKYHKKNCTIVKTGKKGIELADAKKQGYEPCKSCKADEATTTAAQPADKAKAQPKEKTKTTSK